MIARSTRRSRRGSIYIIVLSATAIVVLAGMTGLASMRVQHRTIELEQSWGDASGIAQSAVEHALIEIDTDRWWRETWSEAEATYRPGLPFGAGTMSWRIDDLADSDLADSNADPVRIYGRGTVGESTRVYSVVAFPTGQPLDVLRTAVHASGTLDVQNVLDVRGGPASSNTELNVAGGQILGDGEAPAVNTPSNVSGTVTTPSPTKLMPSALIWELYSGQSTEIRLADVGVNTIESVLISPDHNPYAAEERNAGGVYKIKVPAAVTLRLQRCRIEGTLLIELSGDGSKFTMGDGVVLAAARPDFPALIVYTKKDLGTSVELACRGELSEFLVGVNFNPPHTPYYGDSNNGLGDTYPASITGLVHVIRDTPLRTSITRLDAPRRIFGSLIVDGDLDVDERSIVVHKPSLTSIPPLGYTRERTSDNLLVNGDIEDGLTGWTKTGSTTSLVAEGGAHAGAYRLTVRDRANAGRRVQQDITSQVAQGVEILTDAWVMMKDHPEDVVVALIIQTTDGTQIHGVTVPQVQKDWTRVLASHVPTWTGDLLSAKWALYTTTSNQEFSIDDVILEGVNPEPPPRMIIFSGTWRAEANQ